MTLQEIVARDAELNSMPMGPERWKGENELLSAKAKCPDYRHRSQNISFAEWMQALAAASKEAGAEWESEQIRADYYEGQPEVWVDYYDSGASPEDAISSDMECWD